jgi:hypothetical protein
MSTVDTRNFVESLNLGCACQTLDPQRLREQLETTPRLGGLVAQLAQSHPHLFSATAVFIDARDHARIVQAIDALERVIALPAWQERALARVPAAAWVDRGPAGVFMGYDFHMGERGPQLIEINSNAGGAFLNAALARAHMACCNLRGPLAEPDGAAPETAFVEMFRHEWALQRGNSQPLRSVLIVDDAPHEQYLAPEFELARALLQGNGMQAAVADARELEWREGALWHKALPGMPVDLVYNRLTDFSLQDPSHAALHEAWERGATVVTPHPRTHALYADKRNLITLSDDELLGQWGVSEADRESLRQAVPRTETVTPEKADALWARRRTLFFKPAAGFGGRAAYRGDKLTRRVWDEILAGDYVAQTLVPPSERLVSVDGETRRLKVDLRAYTYQGQVQLMTARTWSGQTTNFRTEGGGFSPVQVLPSEQGPSLDAACPSPDCHADR